MRSKLLKYGIVGMFGAFIHFIVLILLVEAAGIAPVTASIAGFVLTVIAQYGLNRRWTFRSNARRSAEFLRYAVVSVSGLALNALVMYVCTEWLSLHYVIGQALVMTIIPLSNYWWNRAWTFRIGDAVEVMTPRTDAKS
jgi:putative flippase GtrA